MWKEYGTTLAVQVVSKDLILPCCLPKIAQMSSDGLRHNHQMRHDVDSDLTTVITYLIHHLRRVVTIAMTHSRNTGNNLLSIVILAK